MINIESLRNKQNNAEQTAATEAIPEEEKLTAKEFVEKIVEPIIELQNADKKSVKGIRRGATLLSPNEEGIVEFPSEAASVAIITSDSTDEVVATGTDVPLHVRFVSQDAGADTGNTLKVEIQRYVNGNAQTVGTVQMQSRPASSTSFDILDIASYIPDGASQIRLVATDPETGAVGRLTFMKVVKATLTVIPRFDWEKPITNLEEGIGIIYAISGTDVSKTMHVRIYDEKGEQFRDFNYMIGESTFSVGNPWAPTVNPKDSPSEAVSIMQHGVHTIEAWVTVDYNGETYSSPKVQNQVMVVADESDSRAFLYIQELAASVENYVQVDPLFKFAVYNPAQGEDGLKVSFVVSNYDKDQNYMNLELQAFNNQKYEVPATLQIEDASVGMAVFAYLYAYDENGNNFMSGFDSMIIEVDNKYDFMPTQGADFFLNPATRNNNEDNPARILNAAKNGVSIPCEFNGVQFANNDGWVQAEDGQRVLRLLAGQSLSIAYDPFSSLVGNANNSMTFEVCCKISNVTNEEDAIIAVLQGVAASGKYIGIRMAPLEGCVMTSSQSVFGQQNFGWREDARTHIAINICSAIYADPSSRNTIPLVRVFVNGNPYREFMFALEDGEWGSGTYDIKIGQQAADIDIYSLKVYKKALSAQDVMRNFKSSLPDSASKIQFSEANDILAADGTISYEKARNKYSCIVHHGRPTSLQHPDSTTCWIHIDHRVNGEYDPETSGDICKETKTLPVKGQGSTAKHYCDWNQQYDAKKSKGKIMVDGAEVTDGWVDGNGKYRGAFYQLSTKDNKGEKLVGKINYASSMQSHKMGAISAYNDLYRAVMGSSLDSIMAEDSKARCTCKEDWFMFFVQENDGDTPRYEGIMTFGPGKMDKETWGYSSDKHTDFAMFEGADNDQPIANHLRPWIDDEVVYDPEEESYCFGGKPNIDFDAGAVIKDEDDVEWPTGVAVDIMKNYINFGYLHCTDIKPWTTSGGTAESLIEAGDTADTDCQYWVTAPSTGAARGDLYSWNPLTSSWVKAGIEKETRNIFDENPSVTFSADYEATNNALIQSILRRFKAESGNYYNIRSKLFHSCLVENLLAGSDNCAKNTYYVVDYVKHIICYHADDLDTIFKTDNVGWQTKKYYVDRVHHIDDEGTETYSGTHNFFFNTFDRAYEAEKQQMMRDIFTAMATLAGSVNDFMERYFFGIQRGIPCIAYIEQARMRYEMRQIQVNNNEIIIDTVDPITQQLGSQLESELQYMDRRLVYFESYAAYGPFAVGGGGNNFGFRGYPKRDGSGARIAFKLIPHQYIYPTGAFGQYTVNPHVRLAPGEEYELVIENSCKSDTTCTLFGIDYYKEIGNIGNLSVNPTQSVSLGGKRLVKMEAWSEDGIGEFRPSAINVNAQLLEDIRVNCGEVGDNINLSKQTRARSIDLRGTSITKVTLPETQTLETVHLGQKIDKITLQNVPHLQTLTLEGSEFLTSVYIDKTATMFDSLDMIRELYNANCNLQSLYIGNIKWGEAAANTGITAAVMSWVCDIPSVTLFGSVNLITDVNAALKLKMIGTFGDVDDEHNILYATYPVRAITSVSLNGPVRIRREGEYQYQVAFVPSSANNFRRIDWSITSNKYATIDIKSGILTCKTPPLESIDQPIANISARIERVNAEALTTDMKVYLYNRVPKVGDWAYSDGDFDEILHEAKTVIGWVYMVTNNEDGTYTCRVQAKSDLKFQDTAKNNFTSLAWGIYQDDAYIPSILVNQIANDLGLTNTAVRDLAALYNHTSTGLKNEAGTATTYNYLKDFNAYDDSQPDGFPIAPINTAVSNYTGKENTEAILAHAQQIINWCCDHITNDAGVRLINILGWTDTKIHNLTELGDFLTALDQATGATKYRALIYPAAVGASLYDPGVEVDEQYKQGNWYLPSEGELTRLYTFFRNSRGMSPADTGSVNASYSDIENPSRPVGGTIARRPWYANLLKRASVKGVPCPVDMPTQAIHWSSTEYGSHNAWYVNFSSGNVGSTGKCNAFTVRPCVAFTFDL